MPVQFAYIAKKQVPIDAILGVDVERRPMQRERDCSDEARPFDADFVDQRASDQRTDETARVAQAGRQVG